MNLERNRKISQGMKGKKNALGKKYPADLYPNFGTRGKKIVFKNPIERGKKISKSLKGKPKSKEHVQKLKGIIPKPNQGFQKGHKNYLTKEVRLKMSKTRTGKMPLNMQRDGKFGNVARGWYEINGKKMFFRSKWEVNYALYLDFLKKQGEIKKWEYEASVFIFHKIQFGTRSYRPDFRVTNNDNSIEYHEVKGWMDKKSATKLKRMRIYYPKVKLILIEKDGYHDLVKKIGRLVGFY